MILSGKVLIGDPHPKPADENPRGRHVDRSNGDSGSISTHRATALTRASQSTVVLANGQVMLSTYRYALPAVYYCPAFEVSHAARRLARLRFASGSASHILNQAFFRASITESIDQSASQPDA